MKQYTVTGMSCAACSARVEKAVSAVPGVTACSVSLLTNSMGVEGTANAQEITAAIYLGTKKFGKQIDHAVKGGYSHVITMGGDELAKGVVRLKNLATREETELSVDDAIRALKD